MPARTAKRRERLARPTPVADPLAVLLTTAVEDTDTDPRVRQWLKKLLGRSRVTADGAQKGQKRLSE